MLKIGSNISSFSTYSCQPKTKKELIVIIRSRIAKEGLECDLNDIDTSLITDMSGLFIRSEFNGNISKWNTSNVTNMAYMFEKSKFTGDISKWDVSKVKYLSEMFYGAAFNRDMSKWNVSGTKDIV